MPPTLGGPDSFVPAPASTVTGGSDFLVSIAA